MMEAKQWVRNGTLIGPSGTEIDLQRVGGDWLTVKSDQCEAVADEVLRAINAHADLLAACEQALEVCRHPSMTGRLAAFDALGQAIRKATGQAVTP